MGFFKKIGRFVSKTAKTVIAPAVETVSPKAAAQIRSTANDFEKFGASADRASNRFTADVAKGFSKDGFVTNFTQDYIPGGGFVTAIFHAAAGNEEYAQYAAVKGVSSSIVAAGSIAGSMGGPGGAVLAGAVAGSLASAWEGGMKKVLDPSVPGVGRMDDLTIEGVLIAGGIGGAAAGFGYGAAKGASAAGRGAKALGSRAASGAKGFGARVGRFFSRAPKTRPRSNAFLQIGTRARSNAFSKASIPKVPLTGLQRLGIAGEEVATGAGIGILKETAKATGAREAAEGFAGDLIQRIKRRRRNVLAGVGLLLFGGITTALIVNRGSEEAPVVAAMATTTQAPTTTTLAATATTLAPVGTTSAPTTTTTATPSPTLEVSHVVVAGFATEDKFTLLINDEPTPWGGPGSVSAGTYTVEVSTELSSYPSTVECDGPLALEDGDVRSCVVTSTFVAPATTTTTAPPTTTTVAATTTTGSG